MLIVLLLYPLTSALCICMWWRNISEGRSLWAWGWLAMLAWSVYNGIWALEAVQLAAVAP